MTQEESSMNKQLLIVVSREFGSGGHAIASAIAEEFALPLYDKNLLEQVAKNSTLSLDRLENYDESPRNFWAFRSVKGFDNSPQAHVTELQFSYLKERVAAGESFVLLGRCGEELLKGFPGLISIFVLADTAFKKARIMDRDNTSEDDALELMSRMDRRRKYYHNEYCQGKWGDSRNYDLCINSAKLGVEKTAEYLIQYIRTRIALM